MTLETAVRAVLIDESAITDVVGQEIAPGINPDGTAYPRVSYEVTSDEPASQQLDSNATVRRSEVAIQCIGRDYQATADLAKDVVQTLNDYTGTPEAFGTTLHRVVWQSRDSTTEEPHDGSRDPVYRLECVFVVLYEG
tara:strand:- start:209 stop:622 length:414 start_codon:yes stop_codon:yes gene_type:complete